MFGILLILLLTVSLSTQQPEIFTINDKNEHELSIEAQERSHEFLIKLPETFKLIIKVEELDVHAKYGDYLLIKRGPSRDTEGTGLVLTEKAIPDKPLLISSHEVYIKLFLGELQEGEDKVIRKFRLKYTAYGETALTTTELPGTTINWPKPGAHDKIHYNAHLYGLRAEDFVIPRSVITLRLAIAQMADAYCRDQAMPVSQTITSDNVIIADLIRCPYQWPDSEKCVKVNFAVPVIMKEGYIGYQLLAKHLEVMWERYNYILKQYNFENYDMRDIDTEFIEWDATFITCLVVVILAIAIIALLVVCKPKCFTKCLNKLMGRPNKLGDQEVFVPPEERNSYVSNASEFDKFRASANIS